jgi:hypothetical protein
MLGEAHAVAGHGARRLGIDGGRRFDGGAGQARALHDVIPGMVLRGGFEFIEAGGVFSDEIVIDDALFAGGGGLGIQLEDSFADAHQGRAIAAGNHLMVLGADLRCRFYQHFHGGLRIDEAFQAAFAQRVEGDDFDAAFSCISKLVQHSWTVRTGVLAKEENAVGVFEIFQDHGADRHADGFRQGDRGCLVTHVGAVGQIVVAVHACEQAVHVGGFQRGAAGGVEDDFFRIVTFQQMADFLEGLVPGDRDVVALPGFDAHRLGEAAGLFQVIIRPGEQFGHGMLGEEFGRGAAGGNFPGRGFGAVLTIFENMRGGRLGPGAADAGETVVLVLPQQLRLGAERHPLPG